MSVLYMCRQSIGTISRHGLILVTNKHEFFAKRKPKQHGEFRKTKQINIQRRRSDIAKCKESARHPSPRLGVPSAWKMIKDPPPIMINRTIDTSIFYSVWLGHRARTGNEKWSHRYICAARWPLENNRIIWWAQVGWPVRYLDIYLFYVYGLGSVTMALSLALQLIIIIDKTDAGLNGLCVRDITLICDVINKIK